MDDLLNKYMKEYEQLVEQLVEYHNLHTWFIKRPSTHSTPRLRKIIKQMRTTLKNMADLAQARKNIRVESIREKRKGNEKDGNNDTTDSKNV